MTDNPLVEAVAKAICASQGLDWDAQASFLTSAGGTGEEQEGFRDSATAALRAIEDAGWKVVKKEDG